MKSKRGYHRYLADCSTDRNLYLDAHPCRHAHPIKGAWIGATVNEADTLLKVNCELIAVDRTDFPNKRFPMYPYVS